MLIKYIIIKIFKLYIIKIFNKNDIIIKIYKNFINVFNLYIIIKP